MIFSRCLKNARKPQGKRLGASLTVFFLFALPIFLVVLLLALNAAIRAEGRATLQNSADAAALAAVQSLVDDCWLTGNANAQLARIQIAQNQARLYAFDNKVLGLGVDLHLPATLTANPADGDIVFAFLDEPRDPFPENRVLVVRDLDGSCNDSPFVPQINTVRINARRLQARGNPVGLLGGNFTGYGSTDMAALATATLDRDVIGFEPVGDQPIPLAPIALLSRGGVGPASSWQNELQKGNDNWFFDPSSNLCSAGGDSLPEALMVLSTDETQASAALLLLGVADCSGPANQATFSGQIANGITAADLTGLGGMLRLDSATNTLALPATRGDSSFFAELAEQLNQIQGQKRIWPLYVGFDPISGDAIIAGFVAARVVQAGATANGINLLLQPCMLSTRTALTDAGQRWVGGINITNPYICKVRLGE